MSSTVRVAALNVLDRLATSIEVEATAAIMHTGPENSAEKATRALRILLDAHDEARALLNTGPPMLEEREKLERAEHAVKVLETLHGARKAD